MEGSVPAVPPRAELGGTVAAPSEVGARKSYKASYEARSRRVREVPRRPLSVVRGPSVRLGGGEPNPQDIERPRPRGDCVGGERPCPFVSCAHHLYLD